MAERRHVADRGRRRGRRLPGLVKDLVLGAAGLLGLVAVGWAVYAHQTGATVIVLKTGSMAPDLPAGHGVLSYPVDAADVKVGDIVTTRLDDASPLVTHRVVSVEEMPGEPGKRSIVMRGDANEIDDLFPYQVDWVYRADRPIPYAGPVMAILKSPLVLGGVVLLVGLLVLWAFWPASVEEIEDELADENDPDNVPEPV
ncbi:MAG: signal peptidase I [Aeromicrobium sp.]|uniref:signal peptidase I n=1 Tax=Aeromicrobium sp. TaxID=1871063 RepID=UPI0039E4C98D